MAAGSMSKRGLLALVLFALCVSASTAQAGGKDSSGKSAKDMVAAVAHTLGATDLKSIQYSGTGFLYTFGQSYAPGEPWPKFALKSYTRVLDFQNDASEEKIVWMAAEDNERGGGFVPMKGVLNQDAFVSGDSAWNVTPNGNANPAPATAEERKLQLAITPFGWVKAAMNADPTMESKKLNGKKMTVISFTLGGKYKINGYVDGQNLLEKAETWFPQVILGDMPVETTYSDYRDFSGVKFPMKIVQKQGGFPVLELTVSDVQPNAAVNIQVPAAAQNAKPQPVRATSQQLGDGVWLIRAGIQSVAVEFNDYSVLLDGATDEQRSLAVIAEVKKLIPNKPIRYVMNTHHHLDHAGGLRTFVAEGATIITSDMNKAYYEKIFKLPHTIEPDELAKNPRAPMFLTVKDKYILTDGMQSIEFYSLPGNSHAPDMLVAYVPKAKVMLEADMYNPVPPPRPGAPIVNIPLIGTKETLRDAIQKYNLDVQQFVPTHGNGTVPFAQMQKEIDIEHDQLQKFTGQNQGN